MTTDVLLEELGYLLAGAVNLSSPSTQGRYGVPLETDVFFYEETGLDLMKAALLLTKALCPNERELEMAKARFLEHAQPAKSRAIDVWDQILYQCQIHSQYDYR